MLQAIPNEENQYPALQIRRVVFFLKKAHPISISKLPSSSCSNNLMAEQQQS